MANPIISWTEEMQARISGKLASEPLRDDWPDPAQYTWVELVKLFLLANEHLQDTIVKMEDRLLTEPIHDKRDPALGTGISREALIKGVIQHQIYHSRPDFALNNHKLKENEENTYTRGQ